jgi:hypothetical protein
MRPSTSELRYSGLDLVDDLPPYLDEFDTDEPDEFID